MSNEHILRIFHDESRLRMESESGGRKEEEGVGGSRRQSHKTRIGLHGKHDSFFFVRASSVSASTECVCERQRQRQKNEKMRQQRKTTRNANINSRWIKVWNLHKIKSCSWCCASEWCDIIKNNLCDAFSALHFALSIWHELSFPIRIKLVWMAQTHQTRCKFKCRRNHFPPSPFRKIRIKSDEVRRVMLIAILYRCIRFFSFVYKKSQVNEEHKIVLFFAILQFGLIPWHR